jgi:enoyl-CoA hydratase/carnithine racemase
MALACDFVIATEDAIIGEPEVRTVTTSAFHIVPWLVGLRRAKELYLTGAKITGVEAAEMGLINKAVPADRLDEAVKGLVQQLTSMPPAAVALNKRAINKTYEIMGLRNSIAYNLEVLSLTHSVESLGGTQAEFSRIVQQKGLKAALEKRDTVS